jgi:hypothetical protein
LADKGIPSSSSFAMSRISLSGRFLGFWVAFQ